MKPKAEEASEPEVAAQEAPRKPARRGARVKMAAAGDAEAV